VQRSDGETGRQPKKRVPGRRPGPAEREEILRLWDAMSHDGRKIVYATVRAVAVNDGVLPAGSSVLVRGKE